MNKSILTLLALLFFTSPSSAALLNFNGTFQLLDSFGDPVAATDTNVSGWFNYDFAAETGVGGQFNSGTDLLGSPWQANDITMNLNADGNVTANMIFDWNGNAVLIVIVFGIEAGSLKPITSIMTTLDGDGDGILGNVFFTVNGKPRNSIVMNGTATVVPVPAAFWLFTSGLMILITANHNERNKKRDSRVSL